MKLMNLKSVIATTCFSFLMMCSVAVFAQDKQHKNPEEKAKMMSDKMKTELTLTDEQYTKVQAINLDFATKASAIKQEGTDKAAWGEKMKPLKEEHAKALKGVLTPEQFTKYESIKDEMKKDKKQHEPHQHQQ
ncbi:MAG: hypothetical protein ACTHMM_11135 [Agriterribacter sp.]